MSGQEEGYKCNGVSSDAENENIRTDDAVSTIKSKVNQNFKNLFKISLNSKRIYQNISKVSKKTSQTKISPSHRENVLLKSKPSKNIFGEYDKSYKKPVYKYEKQKLKASPYRRYSREYIDDHDNSHNSRYNSNHDQPSYNDRYSSTYEKYLKYSYKRASRSPHYNRDTTSMYDKYYKQKKSYSKSTEVNEKGEGDRKKYYRPLSPDFSSDTSDFSHEKRRKKKKVKTDAKKAELAPPKSAQKSMVKGRLGSPYAREKLAEMPVIKLEEAAPDGEIPGLDFNYEDEETEQLPDQDSGQDAETDPLFKCFLEWNNEEEQEILAKGKLSLKESQLEVEGVSQGNNYTTEDLTIGLNFHKSYSKWNTPDSEWSEESSPTREKPLSYKDKKLQGRQSRSKSMSPFEDARTSFLGVLKKKKVKENGPEVSKKLVEQPPPATEPQIPVQVVPEHMKIIPLKKPLDKKEVKEDAALKPLLSSLHKTEKELKDMLKELERLKRVKEQTMKLPEPSEGKDTLIQENAFLQEEVKKQVAVKESELKKLNNLLKAVSHQKKNDHGTEVKEGKSQSTHYEYKDPGKHWCQSCNEVLPTSLLYFEHLLSKSHMQTAKIKDVSWCKPENPKPKKDPSAETLSLQFKGSQFIQPITGYYCKLCSRLISNATEAEIHMQSMAHNQKYAVVLLLPPPPPGVSSLSI